MALAKFNAIVIKNIKFNDNDRILTAFTKEEGKVSILAKRANLTNRLLAPTQLFSYSEFICYPGKKMYTLNSADYILGFYNLSKDVERIGGAGYICELIDIFYDEKFSEPIIFNLLLYTLKNLQENELDNVPFVVIAFMLKLLGIYGIAPIFDKCVYCEEKKEMEEAYFDFSSGGIVCKKHKNENEYNYKLTKAQANLLNDLLYISLNEVKEINKKNYPANIEKYLLKVLNDYITYNLNKKTNSFDFLLNLL